MTVDLRLADIAIADRYRHILQTCEPFLISHPGNWPALNLSPFGVTIAKRRRYSATSLSSRDVINGLHRLDAASFGDQGMLMPRWVLFDCGEFPGIVFGFGAKASALPAAARQHYRATDRDDMFVPLSMWVAIRCAEDGAWFGHNLSSANVLLRGPHTLPGLATITKILGVKLTRARKQYGATQWASASIGLHLRLGNMQLLSAYTPAHTHDETFAYLIAVDDHQLLSSMHHDYCRPTPQGDITFAADDSSRIRELHGRIEQGERYQLVGVQQSDRAAIMHLKQMHATRASSP